MSIAPFAPPPSLSNSCSPFSTHPSSHRRCTARTRSTVSAGPGHLRLHLERPPLLCDIALDVQPGELVAFVGPSGAGKTTLMALLQRFCDPWSGAVSVDTHDIRELKQHEFRKHIGVVLQDPFSSTKASATTSPTDVPTLPTRQLKMRPAPRKPMGSSSSSNGGYDTVVGEWGARLSAAERQRVAIARALLKDPRVLILDEATSSLDAETEALLQSDLEAIVRGRTTFVVAHRLSTVVRADRIVVLRDGGIIETGTHRQLVHQNGYCASHVAQQTNGLFSADLTDDCPKVG